MSAVVFPAELQKRLEEVGVIAVLVLDDVKHAVPVARALLEGGINAIELTLRTPAAIDCLRAVRREVPDLICGIGTVLTADQVKQVADAGAAFAVAPGFNRHVVEEAIQRGLPFAPGIMTPTDIEAALELNCRLLKFFPAEPSGGLKTLQSIAAPYAHLGLKYIPLGGVNVSNAGFYLSDPCIAAVGGSWLAPRQLIQEEDWNAIIHNASAARALVEELRKND